MSNDTPKPILAPCQCGAPAKITPSIIAKMVVPRCSNVECIGSASGFTYMTKDEAIAAWNRRANPWQPIETAPYKGRLLLYVPPYGVSTGHWDKGWHTHSVLNKEAMPTHWQPLPSPPSEGE